MGRNLENRRKLTLLRIMNSFGLHTKILWTMSVLSMIVLLLIKKFLKNWDEQCYRKYSWGEQSFLHIVSGVQLHPKFQVQPECVTSKQILPICLRGLQNIIDIFQGHGTNPHGLNNVMKFISGGWPYIKDVTKIGPYYPCYLQARST